MFETELLLLPPPLTFRRSVTERRELGLLTKVKRGSYETVPLKWWTSPRFIWWGRSLFAGKKKLYMKTATVIARCRYPKRIYSVTDRFPSDIRLDVTSEIEPSVPEHTKHRGDNVEPSYKGSRAAKDLSADPHDLWYYDDKRCTLSIRKKAKNTLRGFLYLVDDLKTTAIVGEYVSLKCHDKDVHELLISIEEGRSAWLLKPGVTID